MMASSVYRFLRRSGGLRGLCLTLSAAFVSILLLCIFAELWSVSSAAARIGLTLGWYVLFVARGIRQAAGDANGTS